MNFKELVGSYKEESLKTLSELIQINSVYDEKTVSSNAPYGKGCLAAHQYMKEVALKDGFQVDECDNRCLEISCGEGTKLIGIFAHLDVVPVSGKRDYEPFGAKIANNVMYGRGTSDDKGPGVAAYYALKALRDANLIKNYRVKLVFGCDEERGSSCLEYYFNNLKKEQPTYGFTPDGDFPLIYGEKGITNYKIEGKVFLGPVKSIEAGVVSNSVIDRAVVTVTNKEKIIEYLTKADVKYEVLNENDDEITINFIGKSAHGSLPQLGINSGIIALKCVGEAYDIPLLKRVADDYKDPSGKNLDCFYSTENMGETTYNVGLISYVDGIFSMTVNFRYPENVEINKVINKLSEDSILPLKVLSTSEVLYYDPKNTDFIKALANVYVEETGDTVNKPMTIGGGTYAKEAKNTVAFGSHFPGKEDHIHEANEKIDLEDFYSSQSLYAHAIYDLGNL